MNSDFEYSDFECIHIFLHMPSPGYDTWATTIGLSLAEGDAIVYAPSQLVNIASNYTQLNETYGSTINDRDEYLPSFCSSTPWMTV